MNILEAIEERRSTRAFLDRPVERKTMEKLLMLAGRAPSAINLQPWEFTVVSGEDRKRLSRLLVKRMKEMNISCGPGSTKPLPKHFVEREKALFHVMLSGLPDQSSFQEFINDGSCNFYHAPTAVIITIDESFSSARLTDIGVVLGYLVSAAHALGLGTCPIGLITAFDDDIKEELSIPEEKHVVIGVAIGYSDEKASINKVRSERAPLTDLVKWRE